MNAYVSEPNTPLCSKFMMERVTCFVKACLAQATISLARMVSKGFQQTM
nr:hypothetical protein [Atopobium sp. oral taxon 416]